MRSCGVLIVLLLVVFIPAPAIHGQACQPQWSDRFAWSGTVSPNNNGDFLALRTFDADGDGLAPPSLYAGALSSTTNFGAIGRWDGTHWTSFGGGVSGGPSVYVWALSDFDDDGNGPHLPQLCVGGLFLTAGTVPATNIATWDGMAWHALGNGISGGGISGFGPAVLALAPFDEDGDGPAPPRLFAGGAFTGHIRRWDGTSWTPVGSGLGGTSTYDAVLALQVFDDDGEGPNPPALYAGGTFTTAGGTALHHIAKWNGSAWSDVGGGVTPNPMFAFTVRAMTVYDDDGDGPHTPKLYVGGYFWQAGGLPASGLAVWDGASWSASPGWSDDGVSSLFVRAGSTGGTNSDSLFAAVYQAPPPAPAIARVAALVDGTWTYLGNGMLVPGTFEVPVIRALVECDLDGVGPGGPTLVTGGYFRSADGVDCGAIARWTGAAWRPLSDGMNGNVRTLTVLDIDPTDQIPPALYIGGEFTTAGATGTNHIARWDGTTWSALGTGMTGATDAAIHALAAFDPDGAAPQPRAIYAAGSFTTAGGVSAASVAKWDGTAWSAVGSAGLGPTTYALAEFDRDGAGPLLPYLYAGGNFSGYFRFWNGFSWSLASTLSAPVYALCVHDDDGPGPTLPALYVGGNFTVPGTTSVGIGRWTGSAWSPLGNGVIGGAVRAIVEFDEDGDGPNLPVLYVGGDFTYASGIPVLHIARWNGTSWSSLAAGTDATVRTLTVLDEDGDGPEPPALYVGGDFTLVNYMPINRLAKWNGTSWSAVSTGLNGPVYALAGFDEGALPGHRGLFVGGAFLSAGGVPSGRLARWGCLPITMVSANPPIPAQSGGLVFRDVLQNASAALTPQGIGVIGTPDEGPYAFAPISVTFSGTPVPTPATGNVTVNCTDIAGNGPDDCPNVADVSGAGAGPYLLTLSGAIPARECINFTFAGTAPGQKLQYQSLPGDVNLNGTASGQDVIALALAINAGAASDPANLARYDINRNGSVTGQDVVRLVQLLNGGATVVPSTGFNAATVAACP